MFNFKLTVSDFLDRSDFVSFCTYLLSHSDDSRLESYVIYDDRVYLSCFPDFLASWCGMFYLIDESRSVIIHCTRVTKDDFSRVISFRSSFKS